MLDLSIHHVCGLDELVDAPLSAADRIVSILGPEADIPPELVRIHKSLLILRFDDVIVPEPGAVCPSEEHIRSLLAFDAGAAEDERLVVHCSAGISRSTAAIAILLAARHRGYEDEIFSWIRAIRQQAWPNSRMIAIGDALLDCGGALVAALRHHYEAQVQAFPELALMLAESSRRSEVPPFES
jgi:predicted protein tyrosine phosphatase